MKVREYLETLNENDQVTMIIMRKEEVGESNSGHQSTVYVETPIWTVEEWFESTSGILDKEIRAFDFPTLSSVWHNMQKQGRLKVIMVDNMPYPISKPSEEFLNRKGL